MSNKLKDFTILHSCTIKDAMEQLNGLSGQGIYVVTDNENVCGSITDGDIRRALLKGCSINDSVKLAMQEKFIFGSADLNDSQKIDLLKSNDIQSFPVLNANKQLVDIYSTESVKNYDDIIVVLMAGGMGTRLGKITEHIPKPMVEVAGKPMLERIMKKITDQGFSNFFISLNYKAEVIENYFHDGSKFNCKVSYLKENVRLGTAGPLSLLPKNITKPIVVMNGDLLTQVDLGQLLTFHYEHKSKVTMGVRGHEIQVPFGVVDIVDGLVKSFIEKPVYNFNVNAGIYIIEPEVIANIPHGQYYDMSTLLNSLIEKKQSIACFPIIESWIDVGRESDLNDAREFYSVDKK
ncbi:MAG: nucleotidyltransferase family protein [Bdellovibrionales bacterium]|nr:nucleotidyltransferase family protein [Bdellovibrionales bacterium]